MYAAATRVSNEAVILSNHKGTALKISSAFYPATREGATGDAAGVELDSRTDAG